MATKADAFKASVEQANHHPKPKGTSRMTPSVEKGGVPHENKRAGAKASTALEAHDPGTRPSRKSTRGGANHIKPDHALNVRESVEVDSPESRHGIGAVEPHGKSRPPSHN